MGVPSETRRALRAGVFLDRDGVLAEAIVRDGRALAPLAMADFRLVPEAAAQVARLRHVGLPCIVFTNQPEIARGLLAPALLEQMHAELRGTIAVDDIYVCPHDSREGCSCHKPQPGLLRAAASHWCLDLQRSFVIGDRWRDIDAGRAVGCFTVLLARPYSACSTAHAAVEDLSAAVNLILEVVEGNVQWNT